LAFSCTIEDAAYGKQLGVTRWEAWVDKTVFASWNNPVAVVSGQFTVQLNTALLSNGVHELFFVAYNTQCSPSIPDYFLIHSYTGLYFPMFMTVANAVSGNNRTSFTAPVNCTGGGSVDLNYDPSPGYSGGNGLAAPPPYPSNLLQPGTFGGSYYYLVVNGDSTATLYGNCSKAVISTPIQVHDNVFSISLSNQLLSYVATTEYVILTATLDKNANTTSSPWIISGFFVTNTESISIDITQNLAPSFVDSCGGVAVSNTVNPTGVNPTGVNPTGVNPESINSGSHFHPLFMFIIAMILLCQ